jgi:hypothetical protein
VIPTMLLTLNFDPIFVYIALALSGVLGLARFLIGWAMRE